VTRAVVLGLLFLAVRTAVAWARDPFLDELFTVWMARRPLSGILPALLHDSGPPLYYYLARIPSVMVERALSIAIACVPLVLLLRQKRWTAALLLAVHPAAVIMSATARPYALCGALLAIGFLLLERDRVEGAAAAFVIAAYTHFAAAFFLPLLLLARVPWPRRLAVSAIAALAFVPGLWLALQQPREATLWMKWPGLGGLLNSLAFIGDDPRPPLWVMSAAFALTIVAAIRSWRYASFVVIPLALCLAVSLVRPVYFPIRFASLLAFPLVLAIADSLERWPRAMRRVLVIALAGTGLASIFVGVTTHLERPLSLYRVAAIELRRNVAPQDRIVATGYLYLETVYQLGDLRVRAFPPEQGEHPGWRVPARRDVSTASLPAHPFLWIGERRAPELDAIRRERVTHVLYENARALIVRVGPAT
jgi:hypothetical protein